MIAIGSDHAGFELKEIIKLHLEARNEEYEDFGSYTPEAADYPVFSAKVARAVAEGRCSKGILCCGTGIGVSIAANKVHGIRAACCCDEFTAKMTRTHNDANILCLGARVISAEQAVNLTDIFLDTPAADSERHIRRIKLIEDIEKGIL